MGLAGLWLAVGSACIDFPTRVPESERCRMGAPGACTPEVCAAYDADLPAGCLADATDGADSMGQGDMGQDDMGQADVGPAGDTGPQEVGTPDTGPDTGPNTGADTATDTGPDAAPECVLDADCVTAAACQVATCQDGVCVEGPAKDDIPCDDGDPCTVDDHCAAGVCGGQAKNCDDGLSCSVDACDGATGQCLHDTSACGCTPETAAADCDDGNPCTTETCSAAGTCQVANAPDGTACEDGDACTLGDHCAAGVCTGQAKACDDGIDCTADSCQAGTGQCVHDTAGCGCAPGSAAVDCDDGNPCTADTCTQDLACDHTPVTGGGVACSDGDPCTTGDACQAGVCQGVPKVCDDGVDCTVDSCDPTSGQCVSDDTPCECLTAADCDDHEPCTSDVCQPDHTCAHTPLPDDVPCLGDGTVTGSAQAPISGACSAGVCRGVRAVAVGDFHACAVSETGGVWCWGMGGARLGTGEPNDHPTPVPVDLGVGPNGSATAVAAGLSDTCVLVQSGKVRCWGQNQLGELGTGDTVDRDNSPAHPASFVSLGDPPFVALSAANETTCAARADGEVACWGWGEHGVLGSGDTHNRMDVATGPYSAPAIQDLGATAVGTGTGALHSCALVAGGDVRCWGRGNYGALGTDATENLMDEASEVPSVLALGAVKLSVGEQTNCVVTASGAVRCWGRGANGILGSGATGALMDQPGEPPSTVPLPADAVDVAVGNNHACAIVEGGQVYCWGRADLVGAPAGSGTGDLLDEPGEEAYHVDLGAGERAVRIAADNNGTCVVLASEQVKCWGYNGGGIYPWLGYGDGASHPDPPAAYVNVMGAPGSRCADGAACLSGACQAGICQ